MGSQPVTILVTHLDRGELRLHQLENVLEAFKRHLPAILLGDLNSTRTDLPLKDLLESNHAQDAVRQALGDQDRDGRVDWILTRGFEILDGGMHPEGPSDHPQYWARLALSER